MYVKVCLFLPVWIIIGSYKCAIVTANSPNVSAFYIKVLQVPQMQYVDKCEYFYSLVIVQHIQVNERGGSISLTMYWFKELVIL
jgi:hypothetical protein